MAYTDVISLEYAKDYLGIDDTSRDTEITRMITSALKYLEKRTNIIMDVKDKEYILTNGCVRVYDYPINTLDSSLDSTVTRKKKSLYSIYSDSNLDNDTITLNVGSSEVDSDLVEAGYMVLEHFFEEGERTAIPKAVEDIIGTHRRFIL